MAADVFCSCLRSNINFAVSDVGVIELLVLSACWLFLFSVSGHRQVSFLSRMIATSCYNPGIFVIEFC